MGIPWAASGPASPASMPVSEKSSGPCTLIATQSFSHCTAVGTEELAQTMDSSSVVQVKERNDLSCHTHCGISCSGDRRTIAILSGSMDRFMVKHLTGGDRPARFRGPARRRHTRGHGAGVRCVRSAPAPRCPGRTRAGQASVWRPACALVTVPGAQL